MGPSDQIFARPVKKGLCEQTSIMLRLLYLSALLVCVTASVPSASPSTQPTSEFEGLEAELAAKTSQVVSLQAVLADTENNCQGQIQILQALLVEKEAKLAECQTKIANSIIFMDTLEADSAACSTAAAASASHVDELEADLDAAASEVESLEAARGNLTCGEVKSSYKASGCCRSAGGQPENRFTFVDRNVDN